MTGFLKKLPTFGIITGSGKRSRRILMTAANNAQRKYPHVICLDSQGHVLARRAHKLLRGPDDAENFPWGYNPKEKLSCSLNSRNPLCREVSLMPMKKCVFTVKNGL